MQMSEECSSAAAAHQGWAANQFILVFQAGDRPVVGLGPMSGLAAAMAFAQSTGYILQTTGSYWPLFAIAAGAYLLALAIVQMLTPHLEPAEVPHA